MDHCKACRGKPCLVLIAAPQGDAFFCPRRSKAFLLALHGLFAIQCWSSNIQPRKISSYLTHTFVYSACTAFRGALHSLKKRKCPLSFRTVYPTPTFQMNTMKLHFSERKKRRWFNGSWLESRFSLHLARH